MPRARQPYRVTRVFDEDSLPDALRKRHSTKAGAWGLIRVLDGRLRFVTIEPPAENILDPGHPGLIAPEQIHFVEPLGPIRMQVEFYDSPPALG